MNQLTRVQFNLLCEQLAKGYSVASVTQQFAIEPSVAQKLNDKIVEQGTFLQKINVVPVSEMTGENIFGAANSPVSGRTDTRGENERKAKDLLGFTSYKYHLYQTNSDVAMRYATMDAWAKFPDLAARYSRYVQERIANDREIIGWFGLSAAENTDLATNPMMQDVNKGWMQYMRENKPTNILTGGKNANVIRFGEGGDYACLDLLVHDLLSALPEYLQKGLYAFVGKDLIAKEKGALFAATGGKPTEKTLMAQSMAHFGGLPWETPSNFPARGVVVTSHDNLSLYYQDNSWRRKVEDNPKKDRVEDYNSRNEGYVVENPEKFVAVEFDNVELPDGEGGWE